MLETAGQEVAQQEHLAGADRDTLEQAARAGLRNGAFEDSEEEIPEVVEEFYSSLRAAKARQGEVEASGEGPVTAGIPEKTGDAGLSKGLQGSKGVLRVVRRWGKEKIDVLAPQRIWGAMI